MSDAKVKIRFRDDAVTSIYKQLRNCHKRFVMNYGGAASSKSWSQAQFELYQALKYKQRTLVIRKTGRTVEDSVIELLKTELMDAHGMGELYTYNRSTRTLTLINGSQFLFRGIDDPEKTKSIQGITRIWIEEASELEERDFDQLNLRMRGTQDPQITFTFNPISEHHWIKRKFFDEFRDEVDYIHSTFEDNPFIDRSFLEQMEWYKKHDPDYFQVYGRGDWGQIATGYEFYRSFSSALIGNCEYDPTQPLHVSFDFNVNPYMTATVYQVEGNAIRQIDEFCLESPKNNTEATAQEVLNKYKDHESGLFLYGDPSGRAEDTRQKEGRNDFSLIRTILRPLSVRDRVLRKAPEVHMRGEFASAVMEGWEGFSFTVDESCHRSIEDFRHVKQEADGSKKKEKQRDDKTGVSMELYGHTSDSFDYFLCSAFKAEYKRYKKGGDPVRITPESSRRKAKRYSY